MTEIKAPVNLRRKRELKQVLAVLGLPIGDVRNIFSLLFESKPLNEDSKLSPGEVATILAFNTLSQMGYARDRIFSMLKPFVFDITDFMNSKIELDKLGLLIIHDNRYVMWELSPDKVLDLKESELLSGADLPLPVVAVCLSILGLYLRTFSKPQSPQTLVEDGKSDAPED